MTAFRKRRWDRTSGAQTWLEQANIPSITDGQIGILYRGAGGRNLTKFRTNAVADIHDAMDFLLYDTIKLESRFDECASESGAFGLEGTGSEVAIVPVDAPGAQAFCTLEPSYGSGAATIGNVSV